MKITINNHSYDAEKGNRLLDIARSNQEHIGYFCGGNSICQTCYIKVLEGAELLSPLSDEEKALLSDTLVQEGTRMACLTTIEKDGSIRIISLAEEVKRVFENNPLQLTEYAAKMGSESLAKFPDTMRLQAQRDFDLWQLISDVIHGIGDAVQLVLKVLAPKFSTNPKNDCRENITSCNPFQLSACCNGNTEQVNSEEPKHIAA